MRLIGTYWDPPEEDEAEAFLARLVASGPDRLSWFMDEIESRTGRRPEPDVDQTEWLAETVVGLLDRDGDVTEPVWFDPVTAAETGWTAYGACLVDGFIHLIAAIYRRDLGAEWKLNRDPTHAEFHQPAMSIASVAPPQWIAKRLLRIQRGEDVASRVPQTLSLILETSTGGLP